MRFNFKQFILVSFSLFFSILYFNSLFNKNIKECNAQNLPKWKAYDILEEEIVKQEVEKMSLYMYPNEFGSVIYRTSNHNCLFRKKGVKGSLFDKCKNPLFNYESKPSGAWKLGCPVNHEDCEWYERVNWNDLEITQELLKEEMELSELENWLIIKENKVKNTIKQLSIKNASYFTWLIRTHGWQFFEDKDEMLDVNEGELILKKGKIFKE